MADSRSGVFFFWLLRSLCENVPLTIISGISNGLNRAIFVGCSYGICIINYFAVSIDTETVVKRRHPTRSLWTDFVILF